MSGAVGGLRSLDGGGGAVAAGRLWVWSPHAPTHRHATSKHNRKYRRNLLPLLWFTPAPVQTLCCIWAQVERRTQDLQRLLDQLEADRQAAVASIKSLRTATGPDSSAASVEVLVTQLKAVSVERDQFLKERDELALQRDAWGIEHQKLLEKHRVMQEQLQAMVLQQQGLQRTIEALEAEKLEALIASPLDSDRKVWQALEDTAARQDEQVRGEQFFCGQKWSRSFHCIPDTR